MGAFKETPIDLFLHEHNRTEARSLREDDVVSRKEVLLPRLPRNNSA